MKVKNKFGNRYSGTLGKETVASSWNGIPYLREYTIPSDPKTELQLMHRAIWARAVEAWHALDPRQQEAYNRAAVRMTGYNLFIKKYFDAAEEGREPDMLPAPNRAASAGNATGGIAARDVSDDPAEAPEQLCSIFE